MLLLPAHREDICKYLVKGYTNEEIARQLFLSVHTVKAYIGAIIEKNHLNGRAELAYMLGRKQFDPDAED